MMESMQRSGPPFPYYGPDAIRASVGFEHLVEPVAHALIDFSRGLGASPIVVFAPAGPDGDVHVKSAWLPDRSIFTVKVVTWFKARMADGSPPGGGIVAVFDARTGDLRALLKDDHHLSDVRTAAAGALAARHLARPDASVLGVVGTGVQAYLQGLAAISERPIKTIKVWGRRPERAKRVARALLERSPGVEAAIATSAGDACVGSDIIVTATASHEPIVTGGWLAPGVHLTAVGADDESKRELAANCFAVADRIVVDSRALSTEYGDLGHIVNRREVERECVTAELGEVLAGNALGRIDNREITICKLIGLGVQDLAAAETALNRLSRGSDGERTPASLEDIGRD